MDNGQIMGTVIAVCTSKTKGTRKDTVAEAFIQENYGLVGDAHADSQTKRQVSLLATASIDKMRKYGLELKSGDFAENLTIEGLDLLSLPVGTRMKVGEEVLLELSQIGKECHTGCAIKQKVGKCIMPTEGIFAKVIHGGTVRTGDLIQVVADA